jgi:hypothetical protein
MSLRRQKQEEQQMLQNLSVNQLEQALIWLDSPVQDAPPEELLELTQVEWFLLDRLLQELLLEKEHSRLH